MFNSSVLSFRLFRNLRNYIQIKSLHSLDISVSVKAVKKMANYDISYAILRYIEGAEKFSFSVLLESGKLFNFDRPITEDISTFEERIVANMMKKLKSDDVVAKIQVPPEIAQDKSMKTILNHLLDRSLNAKFQINEDTAATILVNPPEVHTIKCFNKAFIGFPVMPCKIEASENFDPMTSLFKWKATKNPTILASARKPKLGNVAKKMLVTDHIDDWTELESTGMLLTPGQELKGYHLRLTCTPSNGQEFGAPLIIDHASLVDNIPLSPLLYEERLARLSPMDSTDPTKLRFVSYNILADTYATPEWFNASPASCLEVDYRMPLICKEIYDYNADVITLQEVDDRIYKYTLKPFLQLSRNSCGIYSRKTGLTKEGLAVFYNPLKLDLLELETIDVGEKMKTLPFYKNLENIAELVDRINGRNTIAQIIVFENKNEEKSLTILANTHLYFHPTADHIRLLQTMVCIRSIEEKIEQLKEKFPERKIRTFFCGDFNCTPPFGAFRLLTTGKVEASDEDWTCYQPEKIVPGIEFEHGLKLNNSHVGEELTNIVQKFEGCIDYILYQPETTQVINVYPPPNKATIGSIIGKDVDQISLPTYYNPSDHLPLIADFNLL